MTDVFVSYASSDRDRAAEIVEALRARKWRVFWDRNIPVGKKWHDVLRGQLFSARCVVVLLTRDALASSWVTYEASIALQRDVLVPLLLDSELDPQRHLPEIYREVHVLRLQSDSDASAQPVVHDEWLNAVARNIRKATVRRTVRVTLAALVTLAAAVASLYVATTGHNVSTMWRAELSHIERGAYSREENERLKSSIRQATLIELLTPNANSFTSAFREDIAIFLGRKSSRMKVLFADPESGFYRAMMSMTSKSVSENDKASKTDKGLSARSKQVIVDFAQGEQDRIEFRQFKTEFRAPVILIDRKYCFVTLRLTPDQATESIRLELTDTSDGTSGAGQTLGKAMLAVGAFFDVAQRPEAGYVDSCKRHFDAIWARSLPFE